MSTAGASSALRSWRRYDHRYRPALAVDRGERELALHYCAEAQADEIRAHCLASMRGFKSARVEARIGDTKWRTSVFPMKSGGYFLPVKKQVRTDAGIAAGDEVTVELELL